jgi:alpha-tubulin suppressor-like RCC1 family protein
LFLISSDVRLELANMFLRASTGDSYRFSASSTPSNSSGGSDGDDIESRSDVYIWGEVFADNFASKTDVLIPKLLESKLYLDVHNIASGAHHVAIVNKRGEVFTWGKESGGRLGHGIDKDFDKPNLVEFLEDVILDIVACGEFHTCAVSKSDDFFTWGDGAHNAGLLGHGNGASHWIPKSVNGFLDGLQVVSVACGTWHSALATSNGKLFTFGDGTFGVLGHGDQESVLYPKEVQLLSGLKTMKVACGVWHTAAIVEVVFQSGSNVSSCKLFTWGDGDKYQLGHGNKETYLKPTRVLPLIEYNFQQIACGHTMTVALTTSGHVFAMGSTENGQLGNPNSAGKVPTLVQGKLLGEFVEEISCGAHHVAVLTSKSELYTWGKGSNGRLGHGDTDDKKSPTLVVALKDRHIKYISCGSNFTSCICMPKSVTGTDQSVCFGCKQAFGLTRKRYNCYNCGLVFCYTCSSKKSFKAALAPTFEKPHRVCDTCFTKLKVVDINDSSKFNGKITPHCSTTGREGLDQSILRSTKTLFSSITEPVKYHEIRNNGTECGTTFVRASLVPSLLQLKDIAFPSSLSSTQSVLKPSIPPRSSQSPTCRSSLPPASANPKISGVLINSLRRANYVLIQRVSDLQRQVSLVPF